MRNAIGQVQEYARQRQAAGAPAELGRVLRTAQEQLTRTAIATLGCVAALVPFAVLGSRAGLEVVQPMALVVLGGLTSSTLVNLFVVPAICMRTGARPQSEMVNVQIEQVRDQQMIGAG
jgi:Cu/Ag efflux pump CusA